jgi:hypothetical protein
VTPIASEFGRDFRRELFGAHAPGEAVRLAFVLVDFAYTKRSAVFEAGERLLRDETLLHGRSFQRARTWLVEQRFLVFTPRPGGRGQSRSTYGLRLPSLVEEVPASARELDGREVPAQGRDVRGSESEEVPAAMRAVADEEEVPAEVPADTRGRSDPESTSPPNPPKGEAELVYAVTEIFGPATNDAEQRKRKRTLRRLRESEVTPDELPKLVRAWWELGPGRRRVLTEDALTRNITKLRKFLGSSRGPRTTGELEELNRAEQSALPLEQQREHLNELRERLNGAGAAALEARP